MLGKGYRGRRSGLRARAGVKVASSPVRCPFCHEQVEAKDTWVACAGCLARHHAPCWSEGGSCGACGDARSLAERPPLAPDERECSACAEVVKRRARVCRFCGHETAGGSAASRVQTSGLVGNPGIAAVLSFFYVGLGQLYAGRVLRGILLAIGAPVALALLFLATWSPVFVAFAAVVVWGWQIFDAYFCCVPATERTRSSASSAARPLRRRRGPVKPCPTPPSESLVSSAS